MAAALSRSFAIYLTLACRGLGPWPASRGYTQISPHSFSRNLKSFARGETQADPLDRLPRRYPVCRNNTIVGHARRLRQCHDDRGCQVFK